MKTQCDNVMLFSERLACYWGVKCEFVSKTCGISFPLYKSQVVCPALGLHLNKNLDLSDNGRRIAKRLITDQENMA